VVPALTGESEKSISIIVVTTIGLILLKLAIFGTLCFLFSIHLEERITTFFQRIESAPDFMLTVVALGFIISALAAMLGFSVAIGAFFAGLIFSRDPASVKIGASFDPIYELFSPFFFIGIGLSIQPGAVIDGLGLGLLLLIIAVTGKFIGDGLGAFFSIGKTAAILLGVSMIPRAEIAMIIMKHGVNLGDWAVPPRVFSGMVFVSAMTCVCIPFCVRLLLRKWPQTEEG
jgi:Kef-type K+ transport system membrane component KefB